MRSSFCEAIYQSEGTEPLSPPSVWGVIVPVHERWEVVRHRGHCGLWTVRTGIARAVGAPVIEGGDQHGRNACGSGCSRPPRRLHTRYWPVPVGARQGAPVHCMPAITNLGDLHLAYLEFKRFEAGTQALFLRERAHIKVGLGGLPFDRGPRDIATFSELHELVRKIVHTLMVGRY
jgi:hypothetical protein